MQLYRGMDIGTAKLTVAERDGVPHHLLDIWDVTQTASVADYQELGRACIEELLGRGVTPVLVGGSGLYMRAVLDPIEFPGHRRRSFAPRSRPSSPTLGPAALHARLAAARPGRRRGDRRRPNGRKIVRALEVIALTGQPFTAALPSYDESVYDTSRSASTSPPRRSTSGSSGGSTRCSTPASTTRSGGSTPTGCGDGVTASRALGYAQLLAVIDGRLDVAGSAGRHRPGDPPVRSTAAVVVPPRPAHHLARRSAAD